MTKQNDATMVASGAPVLDGGPYAALIMAHLRGMGAIARDVGPETMDEYEAEYLTGLIEHDPAAEPRHTATTIAGLMRQADLTASDWSEKDLAKLIEGILVLSPEAVQLRLAPARRG
jgi:hypothetical protein